MLLCADLGENRNAPGGPGAGPNMCDVARDVRNDARSGGGMAVGMRPPAIPFLGVVAVLL